MFLRTRSGGQTLAALGGGREESSPHTAAGEPEPQEFPESPAQGSKRHPGNHAQVLRPNDRSLSFDPLEAGWGQQQHHIPLGNLRGKKSPNFLF